MPGGDDGECSCCQPHPELVKAQRPTPELVKAQRPTPELVTQVAALFGAWPDGSYLAGDLIVGERSPA